MFATEMAMQWLRPWWLLALLPMAILMWMAWKTQAKQGAWQKVIDPKFHKLLLGENASEQFTLAHKLSLTALATVWSLVIIILAGPSLKAVEIPAQKSQKGTVILLDLSLSMLADDLAPNRLTQVKYKLTDLVQANPQQSIGLVAYAGTAHTITPISEDNQTLLSLMPSLNPLIMPKYGSNPMLGLEKAKQLLTGAHITDGHILWIADDLEAEQIDPVRQFFKQNDYSLSVLTVGTQQGGLIQIPNYGVLKDDTDQVVLPQVPSQRFIELSQSLQAPLQALQINDNQFDSLLNHQPSAASNADSDSSKIKTEKPVLHPLDEGVALLILLVPLIALIYRRGWLFSLAFVGLLPLASYSPTSYAQTKESAWYDELDELTTMFLTHDQQAYKAWEKQNYAAAEALFETPQWQASALYRLGKYQEAATLFARDKTPNGRYNQANALAKAGDLEGAKALYQKALNLKPDFKDAEQNLALVEKLLQEQQPPETEPEQGDSQQNQQTNQQTSSENNASQQASQADSKPAEDGEISDQPQTDQANTANANNNRLSDSNQNSSAQNQPAGDNSQQKSSRLEDSLTDAIENKLKNSTEQKDGANQNEPKNADKADNTESATKDPTQNGSVDENTPEDAKGSQLEQQGESAEQPTENTATQTQVVESQTNPKQSDSKQSTGQPNQLTSGGINEQALEPQQDNEAIESELATENWIQQIPDTPSLFLKRKFEYQYNQQQANSTTDNSTNSPRKTW